MGVFCVYLNIMKKRRNIPTLPIDFYDDGNKKEKYRGILYNSILEGVEQSLQKNKDKFIMARVDDGEYLKDIEILKDSFKANLDVVLSYYEEIEEYEKCSHTLNLIKPNIMEPRRKFKLMTKPSFQG